MENTNHELVNYDNETGEILSPGETVVSETTDYKVVKLSDGSFKKNIKYKGYLSRTAESETDKIELYKVFNDSENELVVPLKNMVGKDIDINHVFIQPYESFNEETGTVSDGVTVTLQDIDGNYYATSSKSVYHSINRIMQAFGYPHEESYKPVKVKVTGTKRNRGIQIDLELIGLA